MKQLITILAISLSMIGFAQEMNISYGEHPQQMYDAYLPSEITENTKIVIFIHGGGWQAEHRQRDYWGYRNYVEKMYEDAGDMILINMDYRLVIPNGSTYVFPDQIDDITSVINKVKNDYNLHSNNVILTGNSAGGHLSLWYYLNQVTPIEKVIPICAPYDGGVLVNGVPYFEVSLHEWLVNSFINPDAYEFNSIEEATEFAYPSTFANPELDEIFYVHMNGDPLHQLEAIQEDYPNIRYQRYHTTHSGWIHNPIRQDLINQSIEFIRESQEETLGIKDFELSSEDWRYYNIHGKLMKGDFDYFPKGYYIKNNGVESIKIYKK